MASDKENAIAKKKCTTPEFRASFPAVFKAKAFEDQEAKFSVTMLFPKNADLKETLRRAAFNATVEKWGPDKTKWPKNLRSPFRDGDDKDNLKGYRGCIYVTATSKHQPGVIDRQKNEILAEADFYAGCYARATVIAFAYDVKGNKGIGFSLQNVQKLRDGEKFSGRKDAVDDFDDVEDTSDDEHSYDSSGDDDNSDSMGF